MITRQFFFSYGTLLPGFAPSAIAPTVEKLQRVGKGFVRGLLFDLGAYPGATLKKSGPKVWGVVFALPHDAEVLSRLDEYEDFDPSDVAGSEFVRKKCAATLTTGKTLRAWVYIYNRKPGAAPLIKDGNFAKSRKQKGQHGARRATRR